MHYQTCADRKIAQRKHITILRLKNDQSRYIPIIARYCYYKRYK
jgi:hypothetical protein